MFERSDLYVTSIGADPHLGFHTVGGNFSSALSTILLFCRSCCSRSIDIDKVGFSV